MVGNLSVLSLGYMTRMSRHLFRQPQWRAETTTLNHFPCSHESLWNNKLRNKQNRHRINVIEHQTLFNIECYSWKCVNLDISSKRRTLLKPNNLIEIIIFQKFLFKREIFLNLWIVNFLSETVITWFMNKILWSNSWYKILG